jgi:GTP cyclohydrolase I
MTHRHEAHPATEHARAMLAALGIDTGGEDMKDTPARLVGALAELTAGLHLAPARHLAITFPPPSQDPPMVVVPRIPIVSVCEHHMLPFEGTATVAYLPAGRIVGLSKLARVAQEFAARPQVQERLGDQIVATIDAHLETRGSACLIRAVHTCMTLRGARAAGAAVVTSHLTGRFRTDKAARDDFMVLAAG